MVSTFGDRGDPNPPAPTMARNEPGMTLRPSTTAARKTSTTNSATTNKNNSSNNRVLIAEEANNEKLITPHKEYVGQEGCEYSKLWTHPDDDEPGAQAVRKARQDAQGKNAPWTKGLMKDEDEVLFYYFEWHSCNNAKFYFFCTVTLLQIASGSSTVGGGTQDASEDAAEDADGSVDETAFMSGCTIKARIKEALEAMSAPGRNGTRVSAQIVLDSIEYKSLSSDLRFASPNAVMLQIDEKRLHLPPNAKSLRCLIALLTVLEARSLPSNEPGKNYCTCVVHLDVLINAHDFVFFLPILRA